MPPASSTSARTSSSAGSSGNPLKQKLGGLPMWAWGLGLAIAVGGVWYVRRRNAAAAAAAAAASGSSGLAGTGAASTPYGPPSYGYTGSGIDPSTLAAILSSQGSGNTATGTSAGTPTPTLLGQGYYVPGSTVPVTDAKGNTYEWVQDTAQLKALQQQGAAFFYQPIPGFFSPYTVGGNVTAPVFVKIPTSGQFQSFNTSPNPGMSVPGLQTAA